MGNFGSPTRTEHRKREVREGTVGEETPEEPRTRSERTSGDERSVSPSGNITRDPI